MQRLKTPFGKLIQDRNVSKARILGAIKGAKKVITVGDATTERLISFGIIPDVSVIDGKERRSITDRQIVYPAEEFRCVNPPGTITRKAIDVLKQAIKETPPTRVKVDGEEDLLALPLFQFAPIGSVVLYGQPLEGLVVVKITRSKQEEAKTLMETIMNKTNSIPEGVS
ncbi:MAG TPA: GTP-dependent dephospho-CoA kinase family protein [Nitrososphaera sp.]|nr:GTP-dependent dephospho-CoA kinase family protein [Nitrososphaera sp.]